MTRSALSIRSAIRPPIRPTRRRHGAPEGAAVITALVLVLVVTALSAGLAAMGHAAIARAQVQRDAGQAAYVAEAARDYARWILLADQRGFAGSSATMDHLLEPWAQNLPRTRLDLLFGAQLSAADRDRFAAAYLSGGLLDAQSRFNLQNLVSAGEPQPLQLAAFQRLCQSLGMPEAETAALIQRLLPRVLQSPDNPIVPSDGGRPLGAWPEKEQLLDSVTWSSPAQRLAFEAEVDWLPGRTLVNANTASARVLQALLPGLANDAVQQFIAYRERIPLRSESELAPLMPGGVTVPPNTFSTQSNFFRLEGVAQFGQAERVFEFLLRRQTDRVVVLSETAR